MRIKTEILEMIRMQAKLNNRINPNWRKEGNNWNRAIWVECAEMLDHYGWKWWKKQEPNMEQVELEIVDIWHFVLSQLIEMFEGDKEGIIEYLLNSHKYPTEEERELCAIELVACQAARDNECIAPALFGLMNVMGMPFEEVYQRYIGKNVLNDFRQDHGYKEGTYVKVWNGHEDNVWLADILSDMDLKRETWSPQDIYDKLNACYLGATK